MQLNRGAYEKFEAAAKSGRMDAVKELGASNVGESINVFENADVVIFQSRMESEALGGKMFLTQRRGKFRGKRKSNLDFFAQPFDVDENGDVNEMKLVEDAHLPAKHCRGVRELGDGIQQEYDAGRSTREERSAARSASLVNGGGISTDGAPPKAGRRPQTAQPVRRGQPRHIPEEAGDAVLEEEYSDDLGMGFDGL